MLHLGRLRALREVADRGTIAAAADALHLTPSAVSQQIAALERDIGEPLVAPDGRTVRLTPVAKLLVRRADAIFAEVESLRAEIAEHAAGERADLRVGAFATAVSAIVAPAAGALAVQAPRIRLEVTEAEAPVVFDSLHRGELDLAVSMEAPGAPGPDDPRVVRIDLGADPLDAVVPAGHPLAARAAVPLAALRGERWIAPPEGWTCEQVIAGACRQAGFSADIAHRTADWGAAVAMAAAGLGVCLIPRLAHVPERDDVAVLALADPVPARHLFLAVRRGAERAPALRVVVDAVLAAAREELGAALAPAA